MNVLAIATIALVAAQDTAETMVAAGAECNEATPCADETLECAVSSETVSTCQDCTAVPRTLEDGTTFACAADSDATMEEEASMTLAASAMAVLAAATIMA